MKPVANDVDAFSVFQFLNDNEQPEGQIAIVCYQGLGCEPKFDVLEW